ncbi:MAG: hypothetical protein IT262_22060 [Saprospiraceae bacterium]|nr:hypothetical protein [Saprospiraceae bacterium]
MFLGFGVLGFVALEVKRQQGVLEIQIIGYQYFEKNGSLINGKPRATNPKTPKPKNTKTLPKKAFQFPE